MIVEPIEDDNNGDTVRATTKPCKADDAIKPVEVIDSKDSADTGNLQVSQESMPSVSVVFIECRTGCQTELPNIVPPRRCIIINPRETDGL